MVEFFMANENDIDELTKMRIEYIKDDQGRISDKNGKIMRKKLPAYFLKHLNNDLLAFVAKENDVIVATALLLLIEKPSNPNFINGIIGEVLSVYTQTQYRRKGISTKLMENLIAYSKEQNLDFIELSATEEGYSLYKKIGFKEHNSTYISMRFEF